MTTAPELRDRPDRSVYRPTDPPPVQPIPRWPIVLSATLLVLLVAAYIATAHGTGTPASTSGPPSAGAVVTGPRS